MFLDTNVFSTIIENTPLISIDLIIKNKNGEILLGKRKNKPAKNSWFVPGGRIYKNEKLEEAFKRITKEEIDKELNIKESKFLGIFEHFYDENVFDDKFGTHYIVLGFELFIDEKFYPNITQHETYNWFEENALLKDDKVYSYVKDYFNTNKGIR